MSDAERKGYVYLIVNDLVRDQVKIGFTRRDPLDRARELKANSNPGTYVVIYQALVMNAESVEQEVHRRLASHNRELEWFVVCPNRAKQVILECAGTVLYEDTVARWPSSQPEPQEWTKTALNEARLKAEEDARRQQQAEEEARRLAEEERIQKAKADEEARKQAELVEYRKRAEETARAAAEAAREEERRRRKAIDAENARRAQERLAQTVLRACGAMFVVFLVGAMLYVITAPHSAAAIARFRGRVEEAATRLEFLDDQRSKKWDEQQVTLQQLERLPEAKAGLDRDAKASADRAATARIELRYAEVRLRNFLDSPPRESERALLAQEQVLRSAVESRKQKYREAYKKAIDVRGRLDQLPTYANQLGQRAVLLKQEVSALESQVEQQKRVLRSVERDLSIAVQHNRRWGR